MAEIEGLVRALREDVDAAKAAAALSNLACYSFDNQVRIAVAGGVPPLVQLLRDGSANAKRWAARALGNLAHGNDDNRILIAEAGGIPPLVQLVHDGSTEARWAAWALRNLAHDNAANKVLIAEAGGIAPLVELLRDGSADAMWSATWALVYLADNNDANAVAIAAAAGLEAIVELARRGCVTVDNRSVVWDAGIATKRKAALVVAALLRACVPDELRSRVDVQDVIRGVIGPYL
jgi:vacuolar protein 8